MTKFADCKTLTNAINVRLDQVYPDGRWSATVMQTQSDFNRLEACMQDETVTASLHRRQADGGDGASMASLGLMYEDGRGGLPKDVARAGEWYRKGAATGDGFAMYVMGRACEFGLGVSQDRAEAVRWYRKAAAAGSTQAADRLKTIGE